MYTHTHLIKLNQIEVNRSRKTLKSKSSNCKLLKVKKKENRFVVVSF